MADTFAGLAIFLAAAGLIIFVWFYILPEMVRTKYGFYRLSRKRPRDEIVTAKGDQRGTIHAFVILGDGSTRVEWKDSFGKHVDTFRKGGLKPLTIGGKNTVWYAVDDFSSLVDGEFARMTAEIQRLNAEVDSWRTQVQELRQGTSEQMREMTELLQKLNPSMGFKGGKT